MSIFGRVAEMHSICAECKSKFHKKSVEKRGESLNKVLKDLKELHGQLLERVNLLRDGYAMDEDDSMLNKANLCYNTVSSCINEYYNSRG